MKLPWLNWVGFAALFVSIGLQLYGKRIQRRGGAVPMWISLGILFCTAVVLVNLIFNWFM